MYNKIRARKGVTIAEITVALALVSIMTMLIVTFTSTITKCTKSNEANDDMRYDCIKIEATAEAWLKKVVNKGYTVKVVDDQVLTTDENTSCKLRFNESTISSYFIESDSKIIRTETVQEVTFQYFKNDNQHLIICKIKCINPYYGDPVYFEFCINYSTGA